MQLNPEAVVFLRNEMTVFLNGCEGVVVEEGKWGTILVAAGVLSNLMEQSDRTLSLTDSPGGDVVMVALSTFVVLTPPDVKR